MVVLLYEDWVEVWDLDMFCFSYSIWFVDVSQIKQGFIVVKGYSMCFSEGVFFFDGIVLVIVSYDGYVKFWQIYIEG